MIVYRAILDVPRELVWFVAEMLLAERRRRGTPGGRRALSCFCRRCWACRGSATAPPWMRWRGIMASRGASACRYLDEVIIMLGQEAPDLR